ncbi:hypothetical protein GF412_05105 [Candidatus Micrarchaeota archaeon]|nr:hypothetical protein [Candidatus Micrarchaeota archaeon]MBD3418332.1 hypothetical protein [Candidatus Micrarchaeota archaeon]
MKQAPVGKENTRRQILEINSMRMRLARWGKELLENHVPLRPPKHDGTQLVLNTELWDAFCRKDRNSVLRLVKAGADPRSIGRQIDRKQMKVPL